MVLFGLLLREFLLLGVPVFLGVVAWTGFLGGVAWVLAAIVGLVAGVYGSARAGLRYANIRDYMKQDGLWIEGSKEFQKLVAPPSIAMLSTIGGMGTFAAIIGFIAWGVRAVLF